MLTAQINTDKRKKRHKIEFYHVQKSDNLFQISRKFGLKVKDLKSVNPGLTNDIYIGQVIIIPVYLTFDENKVENENITYKVKPKETLYALSKKFGVSVDAIEEANPIIKEKGLMAGYEIIIPKKDNAIVDIKEIPTTAPIILKDTTSDFREYKVKFLEKIKGISRRENVELKEIYRLNPSLRNNDVKWGDIIILPKEKNNIEYVEYQGITYFIHHVGYAETLPDILEKYKITKEQFLTWNPDITLPLTKGQDVRIKKYGEDDAQYTDCLNRKTSPFAAYKVAVMIPFHLNEIPEKNELWRNKDKRYQSFNFIQYYEGLLLAVERLESQGINADFYFYDVGKYKSDADKILEDRNLRTMDLIIGPIYNTPFQVVSDFAQEYDIKIINPLSQRQSIIENANNVFKVQPSYQASLKSILDYINSHFQESVSVYLVRNNQMKFTDEISFFKNELAKMYTHNVKEVFTVDYIVDSLHTIMDHKDSASQNVVIGLFDKKINTIDFIRHLNQFHDKIPNLTLMGFSKYSDFEIDNIMLQNLNAYIFDHRFIDYSSDETKWFVRNFRERYHTEPQADKFAFIGYDVLTYFVTAMQKYGYDFEDCIRYYNYVGIQNQISLMKNENGAFENMGVSPTWYHNFEKRKLKKN